MPKKAAPPAWAGAVNGHECKLTDGSGGLVLHVPAAVWPSKMRKLPAAVHSRGQMLAELFGLDVAVLPEGLLVAAGVFHDAGGSTRSQESVAASAAGVAKCGDTNDAEPGDNTAADHVARECTAGDRAGDGGAPGDTADCDAASSHGVFVATLNPATQVDDVEMDDDSNPGSPVAFGDLESELLPNPAEAACEACELCDDDRPRAFDFHAGGYCCEECVGNSDHTDRVAAECEAVLHAREAASRQPPPVPPQPPVRRSARVRKAPESLYDLERSGPGQPGWSSYDLGRLDSRHGRVRDETYPELQAARDQLHADFEAARRENSKLAGSLDHVYGRLRELVKPRGEELELADCERTAAVILREAIAELTDELERRGELNDATDPALDVAGSSATAQATESATATPDASTLPLERWEVDGLVRMGGVSGTEGVLSIGLAYVEWLPSSGASDHLAQQLPLSEVLFAEIAEHDEVSAHKRAHKRCHNTHLSSDCRRMLSCVSNWLCT